jgi:hypothetical protein
VLVIVLWGFLIVVYEEHAESIQKAEACWSINNTERSCSEMPGSGNGWRAAAPTGQL